MVRIDGPSMPGAVGYDLIAGDLGGLTVGGGRLSLGEVWPLARGTTKTTFSEGASGAIPESGAVLFCLIRSRTRRGGAGYGMESAPWPRMPAAC